MAGVNLRKHEKMIELLGVENAEGAIWLINKSSLAETDPRRHHLLTAYLGGRSLAVLAKEQGLSFSRVNQIIQTVFTAVQAEVKQRARPDHLLRSLSPQARNQLLASGFETDQDVRDHVANHGSLSLLRTRNIYRKSYLEICESFRFDAKEEGPDPLSDREGLPLEGMAPDQLKHLRRLTDALDAVVRRDSRFDLQSLRTTLVVARFPTQISAAQLSLQMEITFEDACSRLRVISNLARPQWGRLTPLKAIQYGRGRDAETLYALSEEGVWVRNLFDRLDLQGEVPFWEQAIAALDHCALSFPNMLLLLQVGLAPYRPVETDRARNHEDLIEHLQEANLVIPTGLAGPVCGPLQARITETGADLLTRMVSILSPGDLALQEPPQEEGSDFYTQDLGPGT